IYLFERNNFNVYLKKEFYQRYDSVKARGVIYSLQQLTDEQKLKGVIAISTGSFALILCYFGLMFNIPITVVMPTEALEEKVNMCRQYNSSRIIVKGNNLLEAHRFAIDIAMKDDLYYLDGNDHPNMIIGQATIGLEILKQRKIDVVLLPTLIDGCGLTTAIAIAIKGTNPKIVVIHIIEMGLIGTEKWQRQTISYEIIKSALFQIREHILKTPFSESSAILTEKDVHIYFKEEFHQYMCSIKTRGVVYTLLQLTNEQKRNGVIAISTGYLAQILCYFGRKFGIPVTVVMPTSTTENIVNMCRHLGATVIVQGDSIIEVFNIAWEIASTRNLSYLDGNDHPNMIIGQATLGIEILEQLDFIKTIGAVILPTTIDGCGVTACIAMTIKEWNSNINIIEVQTMDQDPLVVNVRRKYHQITICDQNVHEAYTNLLKDIRLHLFDQIITVSETLIQEAADFLLIKENINDYYAAIALAGMLSGTIDNLIKQKR
ncbi:Putative threonine dehydratase, partial [Cyphomyrmex costatus]